MRISLNGEWCLLTAEQFSEAIYCMLYQSSAKLLCNVCMGRESTCKFIIPITVPMKFGKKKKNTGRIF